MRSHEERIAEVRRRIGGGAAPEYIIIGLLSFLLGVCVTILCFRVHLLDKEEQAEQRGDRANGIDH